MAKRHLTTPRAALRGWMEPGHSCFVTEPPAPHLRLTFAAATPAELTEATRRLAGEIP